MKKIVQALTVVFLLGQTQAYAQSSTSLSSGDIVDALQPNQGQATRSLVGNISNALSDEDRKFMEEVSTRGLRIETVEKAVAILDSNELPSLDIEIKFEFNSSTISLQSKENLSALGNALKDKSLNNARILLNGHTDAKGSDQYNLKLSQNRANAVREHLILTYGISGKRLVAVGFGEHRLKNKGRPEADINRRVEVINIGVQP